MPRAPTRILSLGEMTDVERQLEADFEVHRASASELASVLEREGPLFRAIATRGRDRIDADFLARLPALEIIANFGVGYDSIDVVTAASRGIVVTNTPDVLNDEVADFAVALLLATVRRLPQADRFVRDGRWPQGNFPLGPTLRDRTIGLIGMGRIGKRIAHRLAAFEVPIVYHSRTPQPEVPYRHYPDLRGMAKDVDTLIVNRDVADWVRADESDLMAFEGVRVAAPAG
jgi:lactate dehydrogenase-like 2-hydroxyacid dehydrogenase